MLQNFKKSSTSINLNKIKCVLDKTFLYTGYLLLYISKDSLVLGHGLAIDFANSILILEFDVCLKPSFKFHINNLNKMQLRDKIIDINFNIIAKFNLQSESLSNNFSYCNLCLMLICNNMFVRMFLYNIRCALINSNFWPVMKIFFFSSNNVLVVLRSQLVVINVKM